MGVENTDRTHFKTVMHNNFATLFPSDAVNAEQVMASMLELMRADAQLAKYAA